MISVVLKGLDLAVQAVISTELGRSVQVFIAGLSAFLGISFCAIGGGVSVLGEVQSIAIVLLAGAVLLAGFFSYVYQQKRQEYLVAWAVAWFLSACYFVRPALGYSFDSIPWFSVDEWILSLALVAFYCSARLYSRRKIPVEAVAMAMAISTVWSVAYAFGKVPVHAGLGVALGFFVVARTFWREGSNEESRADQLLAFAFVASGLLRLLIIFQSQISSLKNTNLIAFALLPEMFGGILMLMAVYEEERRRIERNILALSNLNLATSSFSGGEIQKMLSQALDRVLNVVRIPAGALVLHYGDSSGPASIVVTGLGDSFSGDIQKNDLDDYAVMLVARMGGLVVLRDLARDVNWVALEKEDSFKRVRQLLLSQGLRTVVGISLQAKERVFGVLLLGTPDNRSFTPAQLRLLLALGHQIGMAVENSYLVQQTSRRSEELHLLNEIGRALSSTLEPDALFERIYAEMRRLFDVSNLFIAFRDHKPEQVRFEIEVVDGVRLPKPVRP